MPVVTENVPATKRDGPHMENSLVSTGTAQNFRSDVLGFANPARPALVTARHRGHKLQGRVAGHESPQFVEFPI